MGREGGVLESGQAPHDALVRRHFALQGNRPNHLAEIDLAGMEPTLRGLLFTDGTVTRTLEAQTLSPVFVEVSEQVKARLSGADAAQLEAPADCESLLRRVVIGTSGFSRPLLWAESHILPERLPEGFLDVLRFAADGIGESLQQVKLESWRDLLWLGLDVAPTWSNTTPDPSRPVITRRYRVITAGRPALLISESFAVQHRAGSYCLGWLD